MTTLPFSQRPPDTPQPEDPNDGMLEFVSESPARKKLQPKPTPKPKQKWTGGKAGVIALLLLMVAGGWLLRGKIAGSEGTLRVESEPEGAAVEVDGSPRGVTPLTVSLPAGSHAVVVSLDAQRQELSASVARGVQAVHHIRFAGSVADRSGGKTGRGRLQVAGDVAGATILLDGVKRGTAPITIDGLEPGEHQVVIQGGDKTQRRTVTVSAGATASLVITNAPAGTEPGWMSTRTPTPLLVFEGGKLIGTTDVDRIMLPAGTHNLEFVANALGFRTQRNVTIMPRQTAVTSIVLPQVPANINATPWAEVTIDGVASGQTPIANHPLTIGAHEVEFRHPSLGTKRSKITITLSEPARVAVDMRAP